MTDTERAILRGCLAQRNDLHAVARALRRALDPEKANAEDSDFRPVNEVAKHLGVTRCAASQGCVAWGHPEQVHEAAASRFIDFQQTTAV